MDKILCLSMFYIFFVTAINGLLGSQDSFEHFRKLKETQFFLNKKISRLNSEAVALADEINKIKTSPKYAKKVLKDKYHQLEKNESMIFFDD